ncbi:hypothetical protein JCM3775_001263 [Rhodotorula graminis]
MSLEDYDDLDFDDPRFLQLAATQAPPAELSYAQKRKRALIRSEDKGRTKSRKQHEDDTRAQGLATNLILQAQQDGHDSKALHMMKSMGYKPGDALGRQPGDEPATSTSTLTSSSAGPSAAGLSRGGLGFARASFAPVGGAASVGAESSPAPAPAPQARTEPIRFEMRAARTGLGVPQASRLKPYLSIPSSSIGITSTAANADPSTLPDLAGYLSHLKSSVDERRAHGILRALRRTCEELDRRAGETESYMWRDPDEEEREADKKRRRKVFDRIDQELESDEEKGAVFGESKSGTEGRGELAYERGTSGVVVELEGDDDDDDDEQEKERAEEAEEKVARERRTAAQAKQDEEDEAAEWFEMDVRSRLALMLTYLRNKYHYCFWCGTQYNDEKDLEENCPGTEEDDH